MKRSIIWCSKSELLGNGLCTFEIQQCTLWYKRDTKLTWYYNSNNLWCPLPGNIYKIHKISILYYNEQILINGQICDSNRYIWDPTFSFISLNSSTTKFIIPNKIKWKCWECAEFVILGIVFESENLTPENQQIYFDTIRINTRCYELRLRGEIVYSVK